MSDRAARIERIKRIQRIKALQAGQEAPAAPEETLYEKAKDIGGKTLQGGLRALDYAGGLARTSIAGVPNAINVMAGNPSVVHPEDLVQALKGNAPSSEELLARAEVPEMGSVGIPFTDKKITGRDVLGFGLDVVTDPLTHGLGGAGKAAKAAKIASLEPAVEGVGRTIYKGGFGAIDRELAEKGVKPLSDQLFEKGFVGTSSGARKATNKIRMQAGKDINEVVAKVGQVEVKPDFSNAYDTIAKMRKDPGLIKEADALDDFVRTYEQKGPTQRAYTVADALEIKRNLRQALPQNVYRQTAFGAKPIGPATKVEKQVAAAFTKATDDVGGEALKAADLTYGQAKAALPLLEREAKKAARKKAVTVVDAMIAGGSFAAPNVGLPALALKKTAEAANSTLGRTLLGQTLRAGQKPIAATLRRGARGLAETMEEDNGNNR